MTAYTLREIECSKKPYRLDRDTRRADGVVKFQTLEKALQEDRLRARKLNDTSCLSEQEVSKAQDLRSRLQEAIETGVLVETLASAAFHRDTRKPILEAVWKLVEEPANQPCAFITLRPQGMLYEAARLGEVSPAGLMKRLRNDFDRSGVTAAPGFGFFGLDCEFDANRHGGVYDLHYHGIVGGEKIHALERLRGKSKYRNGRQHPLEQGLPVSPRVHVQEGLYDLPSPITYCLDGWIPHRPTTLQPDGSRLRSTSKRRIPSPDFQRWLIWMDQQRIEDFVLLSNLIPVRLGFRLIRP